MPYQTLMPLIKKILLSFKHLLLVILMSVNGCRSHESSGHTKENLISADWPIYGGNASGNRYSKLSQIDTGNVDQLSIVWTYHSEPDSPVGASNLKNSDLQCQPIVVHGILYATSPRLKLFALQASTGKKIWEFDPFLNKTPRMTTC